MSKEPITVSIELPAEVVQVALDNGVPEHAVEEFFQMYIEDKLGTDYGQVYSDIPIYIDGQKEEGYWDDFLEATDHIK